MLQYTLNVEGMMCGMCENHVNDAVRGAFRVKKVTSSRAKGQTVIETEEELDEERLRQVIDATGYTLRSITRGEVQKRGLFGRKKG